MNYEKQEENRSFEINFITFLQFLIQKLWIVIAVVLVFAIAGKLLSDFAQKDYYTSKISFVVNTLSDTDKVQSSDISASINIATTYRYILTSRTLAEKVAEKCSLPVDYPVVKNALTVNTISGSNVIELSVKTDDPEKSYAIAKSIIENYDDIVSNIYSNAHLNICDYPVKATAPDSTSSSLLVAVICALGGGVLALLALLIYFVVHDTIRTVEDIESKLGLNIFGTINKIQSAKSGGMLLTNRNLGFSFIETFKAIRTKVESDAARNNHKVFVVTSACESEGKTTISSNLAITLAQNGKSVLLVDADLRKPSVNKTLGLENGKGLSEIIADKIQLESAIRYVDKYHIFVVADSHSSNNPSELLSTKKMADIIKAVRSEFDYIIVDTAPASVVTDAAIISSFADATLLVISEDQAPVGRIRMSISDIDANGAQVIGCIYNKASIAKKHYGKRYSNKYYGAYGYYGSYGYGYGYYGSGAQDDQNSSKGGNA